MRLLAALKTFAETFRRVFAKIKKSLHRRFSFSNNQKKIAYRNLSTFKVFKRVSAVSESIPCSVTIVDVNLAIIAPISLARKSNSNTPEQKIFDN